MNHYQRKMLISAEGLERLAAATKGTPDIFALDVFADCIQLLEKHSKKTYADCPGAYRIIADHVRSALFILAEGVDPSNSEAGYVLRRLLRRSMYNLRYVLECENQSLVDVIAPFITVYKEVYPEVANKDILQVLKAEEEKFSATLDQGMKALLSYLTEVEDSKKLSGEKVFVLQSTYGFPFELTQQLAEEKGYTISEEEYTKAMQKHQEISRSGSEQKFKGGLLDTSDMSVKYHTATHLLNQALRDVLGEGVSQKGSNITHERLRFDFSHPQKLTDEEKQQVEDIVNQKIKEDLPITHKDLPIEEARKLGAIGVFGEKYGDIVRVYHVGDYSLEFCGGPHTERTGELGRFVIKKEESVSSGVRRIKATLE